MKKILLFVFALLICVPAFAWNDGKHSLEIGFEMSKYRYREPHTESKPHFMADKKGGSIIYTRHSVLSGDVSDADPSFASVEFRFMDGKTDRQEYAGTGKLKTNVKDWYMEAALKFGRKFQLATPLELWPYMGFGWYESRRGDDPYPREYHTIDAGVAYEEAVWVTRGKTSYFYVPFGTKLVLNMGDHFAVSFNGEFDWLIHGNRNAHAVYLSNSNNLSVTLNQGYGVRLSARAELDFGDFGVFVEPFWRYWKVQRSSKLWYIYMGVVDGGCTRTPMNITREYGLRTGVTF